jgi:4-hydroxy-3-methylbut-2-enyl diphosphate reductase|tara:strand:+ start:4349 stop:5395 length:1047 start_codon:yes stop_codon:yes gene_type:complete
MAACASTLAIADPDIKGRKMTLDTEKLPLNVLLVWPRGFCAGVERAIEIVERALQIYGPPVYVRHEIVHNKRVVETLRKKGAIFVEEVSDIPDGCVTIFSAHGISESVENEARIRNLPVIDATCPLVSKVHREGGAHATNGRDVILIGHAGHPEVEGTMGRIPGGVHLVTSLEDVDNLSVSDPEKVAYVTQTTLSVDDTREIIQALKDRFPNIIGPDVRDICYATQNRQHAVRNISPQVDLLLVVGAQNSSNSNRLREIGEELKVRSYLIDDAQSFDERWLEGAETIGITAGASAPEELVEELIEKLKSLRSVRLETIEGVEENIQFKLPTELTELDTKAASASQGIG